VEGREERDCVQHFAAEISICARSRNALRPIADVPHDSETHGRMERLTEESRIHKFDM
jgi:hypothetical protein